MDDVNGIPRHKKNVIEVFYSYAHEDEKWRIELEKHLSLLKHQHLVKSWKDRDIKAGDEWKKEISIHLKSAQIILLLISPDFMASDYCYSIEMKYAMRRHNTGESCVIPTIIRPVDWHKAPFGKLHALPKDGIPVTTWPNQDEAFLNIVKGIRLVVEDMVKK
ncbi:MAG TPA: toll/interleukin-1 receptor domain-containing protein [Ktedonobacteraceae bacterium]